MNYTFKGGSWCYSVKNCHISFRNYDPLGIFDIDIGFRIIKTKKKMNKPYMLRGGSWDFYPQHCRVADRGIITPRFRNYIIGFRIIKKQNV